MYLVNAKGLSAIAGDKMFCKRAVSYSIFGLNVVFKTKKNPNSLR
ncbi:hypothetical protein DJ66_0230 [Candidatus Liberibacter solanacearum]|uniref:Uncharacterized protein n=1 Tax=Candidatus Liberibacter solanacearum TaxID=556287 RepID=A0A0F4VMD8_9HYPH|nr:hypothetical protein DJ66_0230 [Candidatus Liberibacter solanacearum]